MKFIVTRGIDFVSSCSRGQSSHTHSTFTRSRDSDVPTKGTIIRVGKGPNIACLVSHNSILSPVPSTASCRLAMSPSLSPVPVPRPRFCSRGVLLLVVLVILSASTRHLVSADDGGNKSNSSQQQQLQQQKAQYQMLQQTPDVKGICWSGGRPGVSALKAVRAVVARAGEVYQTRQQDVGTEVGSRNNAAVTRQMVLQSNNL